jgi:hypothetical protein
MSVRVAAAAFLALMAILAFFVPREGGVDELGLFNPVYTELTTHHMTYPVHYHFDRMVVHPPVHYGEVATLMRTGVPLYYAEALPAFLAAVVLVLVVARSPLEPTFKMAVVLAAAIGPFERLEWFGLRPEGQILFLWLAGLVALEAARLRAWSVRWLLTGSALLAYAATLHYYAVPVVLGAVVYAVLIARDLQAARRRTALAAVLSPLVCVAAIYLVWFVGPNLAGIRDMVATKQGGLDLAGAWTEHFAIYDRMASKSSRLLPVLHFLASIHLPAVVPALVLLCAFRPTRTFAIAAAPLPLALVGATAKHAYYVSHEFVLLFIGLIFAALTLLRIVDARVARTHPMPLASAATGVLAVAIVLSHPGLGSAVISLQPRVHEIEIARGAGRLFVGPGAVVGGRIPAWYASGADAWYGIDPELLWQPGDGLDIRAYAAHFAALVESPHMSDYTSNRAHKGLTSWYVDGLLNLRGIYMAHTTDVSYWAFTAAPLPVLVVFPRGDHVFIARADENGSHGLVTMLCPDRVADASALLASTALKVPPQDSGTELIAAFDTIERVDAFVDQLSSSRCRMVQRASMRLEWQPQQSLRVAWNSTPPMRFYRELSDFDTRSSRK